MKVFIYETDNEITSLFQRPEFHVPMLDSSLLSLLSRSLTASCIELGEDAPQIFLPWDIPNYNYYPGNVLETLQHHQKQDYELVFLTSLFSFMTGNFLSEDIAHLLQSPEKMYFNNGTYGGYLKKGQELPKPEEYQGFKNVIPLTIDNYLEVNQNNMHLIRQSTVENPLEVRTYGSPTVFSNDIRGSSTVCAPCYIGKEVTISNSYIGAGSVILSGSVVENSSIFGSYVFSSTVKSSTIHDSILSESFLEGHDSIRDSRFVSGSVSINATRTR